METSRRGSHFLALIPIAPKLPSTTALFAPIYPHPNQTPNQGSNYKKYIINIKKNAKMKDRREYSMSVLGTHHTPKLSFLLDLKQELTLNRTHTQHNATNTKTVLPMLKNRESIWIDSLCRCFARSSHNAYRYLTSGRLG